MRSCVSALLAPGVRAMNMSSIIIITKPAGKADPEPSMRYASGVAFHRPLTRGYIESLARTPDKCTVDAIRAALTGADLELALAVAMARGKRRELTIADIMP